MSTPKSRTVHPCVMNVWEGSPGGAEYSTFAHLTPLHRPLLNDQDDDDDVKGKDNVASSSSSIVLPHLVTAQGSTLTIYTIDEASSKLLVQYKFPDLAGSVCYLGTLKSQPSNNKDNNKTTSDSVGVVMPDVLLIGFAGSPRLSIVQVTPNLLRAVSLIDLTMAVEEASFGATSTMDIDLQASLCQTMPGRATVSVLLGGGVAVACLEFIQSSSGGWTATEPYLLPLTTLSTRATSLSSSSIDPYSTTAANNNTNNTTISTGFGDILSSSFLLGYSEPTLVLLHSNPDSGGGQTWSGRLGREEGGNTGSVGARNGLRVTAVTVTVAHSRAAVLWSTEVPTDALEVYCATSCLVHCVNSLIAISNTGQVQQVFAVNGWTMSTLPHSLLSMAGPNPWPFPPLAISLDGAEFTFVNDTTAFVVLRNGQVYLLQYTTAWCMLPLYTTIGALGQVANVTSWPLGSFPSSSSDLYPKWKEKSKASTSSPIYEDTVELGMLFVGSRLGDSSLLGYSLAQSSVADALQNEPGLQQQQQQQTKKEESTEILQAGDDEYERILRMEEEALYAREAAGEVEGPDVVPPSDDDDEEETPSWMGMTSSSASSRRKRLRLSKLTVVQSLTVVDSITALGPLGPGCLGPLTQGKSQVLETTGKASPALGAMGYIYPCGYGSSGGVALLTVPGRDDRTILAEEDCINAKAIFNLPSRGLVLLSMADRTRFLKLEQTSIGQSMVEVDVSQWTSKVLESVLRMCELLAACERDDDTFCLLVAVKTDERNISYSLLVVNDQDSNLTLETNIPLPVPEGESIRSVAPLVQTDDGQIVLGYTLSTGQANVVNLDLDGSVHGFCFETEVPMETEDDDNDHGRDGLGDSEVKFYKWGTIGAIDIFRAPKAFFPGPDGITAMSVETSEDDAKETAAPAVVSSSLDTAKDDYNLEEEDRELYSDIETSTTHEYATSSQRKLPKVDLGEERWFVAIARQSGSLEVYGLDVLTQDAEPRPLWSGTGCSHGSSFLSPKEISKDIRLPSRLKVQTSEIRFFVCGPSEPKGSSYNPGPNSFCVSIETSEGDVMLYRAEHAYDTFAVSVFRRVPLKDITRPSKEQGKHFMKLRRKGIAKVATDDTIAGFRYNDLFRFTNLSRQNGLFAATSRPLWFIAERGYPTTLCHRCRHVAPAGARPKPITGFCAGILVRIIFFLSPVTPKVMTRSPYVSH